MKVTLTWAEVATAARIGESRTIRNRARGNGNRHGKTGGADWTGDIEAAAAESAAAKALGVYMPIVSESDPHGDLGYGIHVRHTQRSTGCLILHEDDQDAGLYVLVTGSVPTFELPGFIEGSAGKDERYWADPSGADRFAFFVPQHDLQPIEGLVTLRPVPLPSDWPTAYERNS